MKAKDLIRKERDIKEVYENIKSANEIGQFKIFIPNWNYFSDASRLELIENGFKVYKGDWDGIMKDVLIIEW